MKSATLALCLAVLAIPVARCADEAPKMPEMPAPTAEHTWLQQLAGEWDTHAEGTLEPGKPPARFEGHESSRMLGGFWLLAEGKVQFPGAPAPMQSVLTLGYDPQKRKYIGTWIDSSNSYLWRSEGTVDAAGKVLTLESEGPCPFKPGLAKFRDVMEIKSQDHHVLTSYMQGDDGQWQKMMSAEYRRKG